MQQTCPGYPNLKSFFIIQNGPWHQIWANNHLVTYHALTLSPFNLKDTFMLQTQFNWLVYTPQVPSFFSFIWQGCLRKTGVEQTRKIPKAPSFSNNCIRKLFRSDINLMNWTSMMNLMWKIISFSSWKLSKGKQGQLEMTNIYQWVLSHKILSAEFLLQLNQLDSSWRINWTHLDLTSCGIRTGR